MQPNSYTKLVSGTHIINYRDLSSTTRKLVSETGRRNLQYWLLRPVAMLLGESYLSCGPGSVLGKG